MKTSRVFAVALLLAGCNSQYFPRGHDRIATIMRDGNVAYVRDGQVYRAGLLGGGLVDAVAGNPAARAAASEYHGRLTSGLVATLMGAVGMLGGSALMLRDAASLDAQHNVTLPALALLGGVVLELVGVSYTASAEPYRLDAINLFNDAADVSPVPPIGWSPPRNNITLRMGD